MTSAATFAAVFAALYAAHSFGDHWVQTHHQACAKGAPGQNGRIACVKHVATLTVTKAMFLAVMLHATGLTLEHAPHWWAFTLGLAVDAVSHYWADRRVTLARLADLIGKGDFYRMGLPRPGRGDAPHLGSGAYALDQSWHVTWLFVAALVIAS
ncbi:transcriptional regulator [Microbispora sp. H10949]|uniref:transcriptional regulator n=1 Tax=Microbispora sp. H10949 TaxID=2729111 RepID=UPI001603954D|nr:transcriptional regulator [Microbispora sp. H10949]